MLTEKVFKMHIARLKSGQILSKRNVSSLVMALTRRASPYQCTQILVEAQNIPTENGLLLHFDSYSCSLNGQVFVPVYAKEAQS